MEGDEWGTGLGRVRVQECAGLKVNSAAFRERYIYNKLQRVLQEMSAQLGFFLAPSIDLKTSPIKQHLCRVRAPGSSRT